MLSGVLLTGCKSPQKVQTSSEKPKSGMNKTTKGTIIGASSGAVIGGILGNKSRNTAIGAIIGAAAGGAIGAVIGNKMDNGGDRGDGHNEQLQVKATKESQAHNPEDQRILANSRPATTRNKGTKGNQSKNNNCPSDSPMALGTPFGLRR